MLRTSLPVYRILFGVLILAAWCRPVFAFTGDVDTADAAFHRAEQALVQGRYNDALKGYAAVLQAARTLDLNIREWFSGNASFGLALCSAVTSDTAGTRHWVDEAFAHRYWLFSNVRSNEYILAVAGKRFVDSICSFWEAERAEKSTHWRIQEPIQFYPRQCGPVRERPTIIALHGGFSNLREFASHWQNVADQLCALVIIPPGIERVSSVGFSWNFDMNPIDSAIQELIHGPSIRNQIDFEHLYVAGFSQGGHAALGIAMRHPDEVRGAIVIEGFYQATQDTFGTQLVANLLKYNTRFYGIFGALGYKPFVNSYVDFKHSCDSLGIAARYDMVEGMVHELPVDLPSRMRTAIDWIDSNRAMTDHRHGAIRSKLNN